MPRSVDVLGEDWQEKPKPLKICFHTAASGNNPSANGSIVYLTTRLVKNVMRTVAATIREDTILSNVLVCISVCLVVASLLLIPGRQWELRSIDDNTDDRSGRFTIHPQRNPDSYLSYNVSQI